MQAGLSGLEFAGFSTQHNQDWLLRKYAQAKMTISDLLFIGIFLATVLILCASAFIALRGRPGQAVRLLSMYGIGLVIYLGLVAVVSLTSPQRIMALGENRCFDDWCISVDDITRSDSPTGAIYSVTLRMSSRARRVSQRENGLAVYILDEKGRRFEATADPAAEPFNSLLQPGQSITTVRTFEVPATSSQSVLVVGHEGAFNFPGMVIIGDDSSLFHKPTIVRLP